MAIYYKFKSARDYDTIAMDGPFISVGILKDKIFETKHLGSGKDLDIVLSNAQTNEEYLDEAMLIPKNTSVLIRRVPGRPRITVITAQEPRIENKVEHVQAEASNSHVAEPSAAKYPEDEFDEFGNDFYSIPAVQVAHHNNPCPVLAPTEEKVDEESKLQALIDTPALDWQRQGQDNFGAGRGYGRGMNGRMGGRGFGMERKTPPPGYICHRCNVPGHLIQHCPTNGDPTYDVKRVKPPTGIPKSMLVATPDGSYSLPSGAVAVLKPNEDAFEKEMEGLPSTTRSVGELPPELKCPLCKEVMKDAALTSKCCFQSFCDKCIRDHIIAKSKCVCGETDVLADDLLPNKTLRDAINRILEAGNDSIENAGSAGHITDLESARCLPPPKGRSPATSAASKGEKKPGHSNNNDAPTVKLPTEIAEITSAPRASAEDKTEKPVDACESTQGPAAVKEATVSKMNTQAPPKEEVQQQVAAGEPAKKKKKKPRVPGTEMQQWNHVPDLAGPDYNMMQMGPGPGPGPQFFNGMQPAFNGFHPGFNGFPGPFPGQMPPFMGYGINPMEMAFGRGMNMMHPDPFAAQGFGFPNIPPPHRDLAELGNRMNLQRAMMGRDEVEARKAEMLRKRENDRRTEGGKMFRDGENSRMMMNNGTSASASSINPNKSRQAPPPPNTEYDRRRRPERLSPEHHPPTRKSKSPSRDSKRKYERYPEERDRQRDRERSSRHQDLDREHDHRTRDRRDEDRSRDGKQVEIEREREMDRNREARRVPMAAAGNGLSRRRHRAGSFRDSPEEEGPVELPEAARLRDRTRKERDRERDREREHRERDRLHSRSKRRRGERLIMVHDGGDESSEESVNDDEEYENIFSSPLSNHQRKNFPTPPSKNFRSPPTPALPVPSWKAAADEMIGVAVPRKARSACTKRPHESWTSNASPAAPTSPSSSNVKKITLGAKQKQPLPQKVSSSPVAVQDEIEIEIAEVLYGMMRMPTSKQEEKTTVDIKARVSSPISITLAANSSSIAPKRKKQRHVKYEEDENSSGLPSRATKLEAEAPLGDELKRSGSGEENSSVLDSINPELRESNAALDSRSAEKKEETVLPKVESSSGVRSGGDVAKPSSPEKEKFEIDLMAPPPGRSSSERVGEMECVAAEAEPKVTEVETEPKPLLKEDGGSAAIVESEEKKRPRTVDEAEPHTSERSCELKLDLDKSDHVGVMNNQHVQKQPPLQQQQHSVPDKIAQANSLPLHMSMPGWPGGLPTMGYMPSTQGVVPTDTSSLSSVAMQPPPHLLFNQPRPKRCATHCYIARNIQSHQQFTKMNPFWPAAIGSAPLYGTKACNLSLMPPTELQGTVLGRSSNQIQDENSQSSSKSSDTAQRNQILLQQALPPAAAANNIMHGPTFIFPVGQQPTITAASVRPPNSGNTASSGATASANSMNGSASATPAGAPTMTFSCPGMPGNETQYLAIMQNNGYPFPVPAHVGAPHAYRGAPGQPIPFFNGSFYSSQMIQSPFSQPQKQQHQPQQQQAGQMLQSHAPNNQNGNVSSGSSAAQKHLQNHQLRPHGNSEGYPTHKVQSQVLTFQQRQQPRENATQHSDTVGENSPSAADSRGSRSNVAYGQNYGMQMQPTNLGLMSSAAPGGGVVVSSSNHGEKKSQQQVSKAGAESFQSQGYAMTFANGVSSTAQNHATFQSLPEAARQGYQMMAANVAAQQKMNYSAPSEGKSGSNATAKTLEEQRKTEGASGKTSGVNGGQSIAFSSKHDLGDASVSAVTSGNIVDTSRLLNLGSAQQQSTSSMPTSHHNLQQKMKQHMQQQNHHLQQHMQQQNQHVQQHMQRSQSQQPYTMYLQKQQQYATSVAASAAKNKGPVVSNGTGVADHSISVSPVGTAKFPNANSGFPQNLVQSSSSQVQSPQWKSNSPRTTNTSQAQSPSILSPSSSVAASSSPRNVSHKQQSRPQQSQISFAANSKPTATGSPMQQVQGGTNNQAPSSPMLVGSPSTSSVSKNTGGSPRTTASASSAVNKAGQASFTTHSSSQPSKNLQPASVASSAAVGRNNGPSVLGNPTTSSGSKSQQQQLPKHGLQQQAQLFFSNPYMQSQHQQQQITMSSSGGYYIQRHQQQPGSAAACPPVSTTGSVMATSDPAKAMAAAAAGNNLKGGGKTQQHQLGPPGFGLPYVHAVPCAVQVKPVDQKQQSGE